jgi:hypothetical protein
LLSNYPIIHVLLEIVDDFLKKQTATILEEFGGYKEEKTNCYSASIWIPLCIEEQFGNTLPVFKYVIKLWKPDQDAEDAIRITSIP